MIFQLITILNLVHLATSGISICQPCCEGEGARKKVRVNSIWSGPVEQCVDCPIISPSNCTSGQLIKTPCVCCDECARAAGENCRKYGQYETFDGERCADGLFCNAHQPRESNGIYGIPHLDNIRRGTCCCEKKIVKESGDIYNLDKDSKTKALDICLDNCVYTKEGNVSGDYFCFEKGSLKTDCF